MGVEIVEMAGDERDKWDGYVERSPRRSVFHETAALELLETHGDAEVRRLVGLKGEEPIGVFPVFESNAGPITFARSPPDVFGPTPVHLGPLQLNVERRSRQRRDKENRRFIEGCLDWIESEIDPDHISVTCGDRYTDVRPFLWSDYDFTATPLYTYVVELGDDEDELFRSFTNDARRNIRICREAGCEIRDGGEEEVERLVSHMNARYREKGVAFRLSAEFVLDLYRTLGSSVVQPYVCYVDGELAGGTLYLVGGDTMYAWLGGPTRDVGLPTNDVVDWTAMQRGIERGLDRFDFLGAMASGVHEYKSKYNPEPMSLFKLRWASTRTNTLASVYNRLPKAIRSAVSA